MGEEKPKSIGVWPAVKPFVNGGASGMLATCVIQPIDMIKVRIQLGQGSAVDVTRNMLRNHGIGAFYQVKRACSFSEEDGSEFLTSRGVKAIPGEQISTDILRGRNWIIRPPVRRIHPQQPTTAVSRNLPGGNFSLRFGDYVAAQQADPVHYDQNDNENNPHYFNLTTFVTRKAPIPYNQKPLLQEQQEYIRWCEAEMKRLREEAIQYKTELEELKIKINIIGLERKEDGCMEGWGGICKWKPAVNDPRSTEKICAYASGKFNPIKSTIDAEIYACIHVDTHIERHCNILFLGLSAGLLRQATYTTARLGSFRVNCRRRERVSLVSRACLTLIGAVDFLSRILTNKAIEANDGKPLPLYQKALCGLTAGAIGASVGSPADLALIRMQADATLPVAQRRNYTNAFHALYRIVADEGVLALWKGAGPTVVRAMALNMGMLASYDQSVEFFKDSLGFGEAATVVGASSVSGFFASACSLPFDYVKTQIQKMQPDAEGKFPYTGSLDCAMKTLKSGGPFKFYTGFPVYCVRIAPHVMMTWIFLNQIQKFEKTIGL
ncbi:unnamed protein product [Camellia sinensis]